MTQGDVDLLQHLCEEYRINFLGHLKPTDWPECHREKMAAIQTLGRTTFDAYAISTDELIQQPWKQDLKIQAKKLVKAAERCKQRNEHTWRTTCETIIRERFSAEVVCPNCKHRLWRSEIEATRDNLSDAEALRARQNARLPCICSQSVPRVDQLEVAELNNILGHRDNEYVIHEPELSLKLAAKTKNKRAHGKKNRRPDAIYALRLTKNINFLLRDTLDTDLQGAFDVESPPVHRILDPSPYERPLDPMGDTLVFPFLILEAKSGKSADDWHSVQMQSALSARTFLQAQNALRIATGTRSRWNAGPLVWILANKGPDWRLSAAFVQDGLEKFNTIGTTDYNIVDLWSGSIHTPDFALQLLLLIGYVFDWARDSYREDIIDELRVLASRGNDPIRCLDTDTDLSPASHFAPSEQFSPRGGDDESEGYITAEENLTILDSVKGDR